MAHDANDQIEQGKNREHQRFHDLCMCPLGILQKSVHAHENFSVKEKSCLRQCPSVHLGCGEFMTVCWEDGWTTSARTYRRQH
jgi:hypothetical protein